MSISVKLDPKNKNKATLIIEITDDWSGNYMKEYIGIDRAEEFWQEVMQVCGEYRRGDIIEKVNN